MTKENSNRKTKLTKNMFYQVKIIGTGFDTLFVSEIGKGSYDLSLYGINQRINNKLKIYDNGKNYWY